MRLKSGAPRGHWYVKCSSVISLYTVVAVMTPRPDLARHDLRSPGTRITPRQGTARLRGHSACAFENAEGKYSPALCGFEITKWQGKVIRRHKRAAGRSGMENRCAA